MNDNRLFIQSEDGTEEEFEIILTFEHPQTHVNYVVYQKTGETEEVYAARYTEKNDISGTLIPIDSEDEYEMIQEVLDSFFDEEE
jgi:uncharacterized protein YrzB (UPF0473 family)